MGIRLYPNTESRAALEVLANVPAGTFDRLDAMTARHKAELAGLDRFQVNEVGYRHFCERQDDGPIGDLDSFLTFGWGKFQPVGNLGHGCGGRLDNHLDAGLLLRANGIYADPILAEGVHWC